MQGVLVALDELGWRVADAWEEAPRYRRVPVMASTASGDEQALAYVCAGLTGAREIADGRLTVLDDAAVEAAIAAFAPTMRAMRRAASP